MTCCPISSRPITIRLRASPFNITIIQVYAPTSNYSNDDVAYFYEELQNVLDKTPKKTSLWCKGTGTLRLEKRHVRTGKEHVGITATPNQTTEADGSWHSLPTMTWWCQTHLDPTKHPEKSPDTTQTERHTTKLTTSWWRNDSKTSVNMAKTRSIPTLEATMSWSWWPSSYIWRGRKKCNTRIRFDLEKLKDP